MREGWEYKKLGEKCANGSSSPSPSPARVLLSHRADREAEGRGTKDHHRFGDLACIPNAVLV